MTKMQEFIGDAVFGAIELIAPALVVCAIIAIIAFPVCFIAEGIMYTEQEYGQAIVVALEYSPAESHTSSGVVIGPDGKPSQVVTTSSKSDEWKVAIDTGVEVEMAYVSATQFYQLSIGDSVDYVRNIGKISGIQYSVRITETEIE